MERCSEHDLINCKCRKPLASWMVKQFAESVSDRVDRFSTWSCRADAGRPDWSGPSADRRGLRRIDGGQR